MQYDNSVLVINTYKNVLITVHMLHLVLLLRNVTHLSNLICNTGSTSCNCPTTMKANQCDCQRISGSEFYWNGVSCVEAAAYGEFCNGHNYSCNTITQGTYCNGSNVCTCRSNGGYKSTIKSCVYCVTSWVYIDSTGDCYKVSSTSGNCDRTGNSNAQLECVASALPTASQSSVSLADLADAKVRAYFKSVYPGQLWVNLHGSGSTFVSNSNLWSISTSSSDWCGATSAKSEDCGFYTATDCFDNDRSTINRFLACQYTP